MKEQKNLKILYCPAHYRFTDQSGSEYYNVFQDINRICAYHPRSVVITGQSEIISHSYKIIETRKQKGGNWMKNNVDWTTTSSISFAISYLIQALRVLSKEKFDIIHHTRPFAFGTTFNIIPLLPSQRKIPFVVGSFSSPYSQKVLQGERRKTFFEFFSEILLTIIRPILYYLSLITLQRADAILVTDKETKTFLSEKKILGEKIHVVPHGKDKSAYFFNQKKFSSRVINILAAGSLTPRKRFDLALRAFAEASGKNENLRLKIAGDGLQRENLENLAEFLYIKEKVWFLGAIPFQEMPSIFTDAHVFLHTAEAEMFAHVYIEALASGVPIISTNTVGARSILTEGVGFIVSDETPSALGEVLLKLANDKILMEKMSRAARRNFEEKYDLDTVIIPQILSIYDSFYDSLR